MLENEILMYAIDILKVELIKFKNDIVELEERIKFIRSDKH